MKLFKLIIFLMFIAHLAALGFYKCGILEIYYGENYTWLHIDDLLEKPWI